MHSMNIDRIAGRFIESLRADPPRDTPFPHWLMTDVFPAETALDLAALPFAPPEIDDTGGRRETHNATRTFFGAEKIRRPILSAPPWPKRSKIQR